MKIFEFVKFVQTDSKKRTGIVLADHPFEQVVQDFICAEVAVINCADHCDNEVLLSDDQLLNKIRIIVGERKALLLNLELFIAPRMKDGFLEAFIGKLVAEEPRYSLIILFYSSIIFKKFAQFYQRQLSTKFHTLDLSKGDTIIHND